MIRKLLRRLFARNVTPESLAALREAYARQWDERLLWRAELHGDVAVYPFLTQPSWLFETEAIDRLVRMSDQSVAHLPVDTTFMLFVRLLQHVWNGNHFFLTHFSRDNDDPHLYAAPGKFFQYISECKKKEYAAAGMKPGDPLPRLWPAAPSHDLITARSNAAGIGCGVTIVGPRRDDGSRPVVLQQRSGATIGHAGSWSVAPTFVFQPFEDQSDKDNLALSQHVYREIAEEFYGVPEPSGRDHSPEPDIVAQLRMSVRDGVSRMRCVGFGLDGTNLEPNVALLLEVSDSEVWSDLTRRIRGNWENDAIGVWETNSPSVRNKLRELHFTCGSAFCLTRAMAVLESKQEGRDQRNHDNP